MAEYFAPPSQNGAKLHTLMSVYQSIDLSQSDWESRAATPSLDPKFYRPTRAPEVEVPRELPKAGLDETVELLTRVLGSIEEDPDLSAGNVHSILGPIR